ncbi:MAG: ATP-binding cassette domain-containing protein [Bacteroidota bacterium]
MKNTDRIVLEKVDVAIGQTAILQNLNWTVKQGEHWAITGDRASGKTVLTQFLAYKHRLANGRRFYPFLGERPSWETIKGAIKLISFTDTTKLFLNAQHYHYYQQRYNAFDTDGHLTVRQYLTDGGQKLDPHLDLLGSIGIADLLDVERIKLSSGQTRKLLLAKGLMEQPAVLILDNAYLGLDQGSRAFLNDWLDTLVEKVDTTLVIAGHHEDLPKCITHELNLNTGQMSTLKLDAGSRSNIPNLEFKDDVLQQIKAYCQKRDIPTFSSDILHLDDVTVRYGKIGYSECVKMESTAR